MSFVLGNLKNAMNRLIDSIGPRDKVVQNKEIYHNDMKIYFIKEYMNVLLQFGSD